MNNIDGQIKHYQELIKRLQQQKYDAIILRREKTEESLLNFIKETWGLDVKPGNDMYKHLQSLVEWIAHVSEFTTKDEDQA